MRTTDEVSEDLRGLAGMPEFHRLAALLHRLADDLGSDRAAVWARTDLSGLFEGDVDVDERDTGARWMSGLRGVLILLPVMITWGGIYLAVRAYRQLLEAPEAARRGLSADTTFLQLWTTGFGGRTWATLDVIALLDALAIVAVIVVAIFATSLRRRATNRAEHRRAQLERNLRDVLADAKFTLTAAGYDAPDRLSKNLVDLVPLYQQTLDQLMTVQKDLASSLADGERNVAAMVAATKNLAVAGTSVADGAGAVGRQVSVLEGQIQGLQTEITALVGGVNGLGGQVPEVNRGLSGVLDTVQDIGKQLSSLHERQDEIIENLSVLADNPLAAAQSAQRTATLAAQSEERLQAALTTLPTQLAEVGKGVVAAVDRELDERRGAAAELSTVSRSALDTLGQVHAATDRLLATAAEQRSLPSDIIEAATRIAANLELSRMLADRLQQVDASQPRRFLFFRRS